MLDGIHKIHLIGIGGSGMRAIANILIQKGYDVSGSDIAESAVISKFRDMGATVHIGHNKEYVNGVDAIVRSTAIREDNPEIVAAKEQGITILHRSDIVKAVLDVTDGIAVAGAHGKTSTTSMIGQILVEGQMEPTVIIGGEVDLRINIYRGQVDTNNAMINANGTKNGANGVKCGVDDGTNSAEVPLNKEQTQIEKLLQIIEKNPSATQAYYAEKMGISKRTVSRMFASLQEKGRLVQGGTKRKANWKIIR